MMTSSGRLLTILIIIGSDSGPFKDLEREWIKWTGMNFNYIHMNVQLFSLLLEEEKVLPAFLGVLPPEHSDRDHNNDENNYDTSNGANDPVVVVAR